MTPEIPAKERCGIDSVEIARVEKLLSGMGPDGAKRLFTERELEDAGDGPGRVASLAARFAAKEACAKLFPRETGLGVIEPADFGVERDAFGATRAMAGPRAQPVLDRYRVAAIRLSLTHTATTASAVALAEPRQTKAPWYGKALYHLFPYRRALALENLRRVFGDTLPGEEIVRLAQAYYGHYGLFAWEFLRLPFMTAGRRRRFIRVENMESPLRAHEQGKGLLLLTGHFGNWEVSTAAGIQQFPQYRNLFHFVRRPLKPRWFNDFIAWKDRRAGFGTLSKRGSLDRMLDLLSQGAIIVFVFDQHAGGRDGVVVDFFGHPAGTFKSLALIALETGAPVIPSSSWREPDGTHVLRFEEPLPLIESDDAKEAIRLNTRAYNAALERMLLRHPEQWIWMHRRWKVRR